MSEQKNSSSLAEERLEELFREMVCGGLEDQSLDVSEFTEFYLVRLLSVFLRADPEQLSRVLGVELLSAVNLDPELRYRKLKDVADTSLFMSGVFLDNIEARLPTTDYFFEVGSRAYLDLSSIELPTEPTGQAFAETYDDLGRRFEDFARVLASVSDQNLFASNETLLRLYRRWLASGSARDRRRLTALGLIPVDESPDIH